VVTNSRKSGEVKSQLTEFRSDVFNKLDKVIGLMQKHEQETTLLAKHSKNHTDKIEAVAKKVNRHESRLKKVEIKLQISPAI